jgi:hypothetical protein
MVWICSEQTIGFLKGWFHSLKWLCINIKDEKSHKFATYWVAACIRMHAFAMQCEAEEQVEEGDGRDPSTDPFINEGLSSSSDSDHGMLHDSQRQGST